MKSHHDKTEVLTRVLKGATLTSGQQALLVKAAVNVESDHYAAEFLRTLAATDRVRDAAVSAAESLSRHYRDRVRTAAGRSV